MKASKSSVAMRLTQASPFRRDSSSRSRKAVQRCLSFRFNFRAALSEPARGAE